MSRRFFVVIDMTDDEWEGGKEDLACWIDSSMNGAWDANDNDIESTVYDNMEDFVHDHILDVMASVSDEQVE